jgi:hypothetical protein
MYLLYLGILITAAAMLFRFKPTARPALPATDREPPEPVETHPEETGDLGWLPPKSDACDVCFESEGEGKKIRRCSVCKNQFYCVSAVTPQFV